MQKKKKKTLVNAAVLAVSYINIWGHGKVIKLWEIVTGLPEKRPNINLIDCSCIIDFMPYNMFQRK